MGNVLRHYHTREAYNDTLLRHAYRRILLIVRAITTPTNTNLFLLQTRSIFKTISPYDGDVSENDSIVFVARTKNTTALRNRSR